MRQNPHSLNSYTKAQVMRFFKQAYAGDLATPKAQRDWPALQLAWVSYTDSLQKQGRITETQRTTWTTPSFLKKGGAARKPRKYALSH